MLQINHSVLVPYSVEKMYNLVNDVNSYSQFLPGCINSQVLKHINNEMTVLVKISKSGIKNTFITHNILKNNKSIKINLVTGPFHKLMGNWLFMPINNSTCIIKLCLEFEFTNKLIELTFSGILKNLVENIIQVFTQRAYEVYNNV